MDELGRRRAERLEQPPVDRLVGPVVVAADDVRDAEVDVVDHRRQLIRGRAVLAQQGQAIEAVAERGTGLAMALGALALPHRSLVPRDPEPLEIAEDRLLPARDVARSVGVVDAQEHPVAEPHGFRPRSAHCRGGASPSGSAQNGLGPACAECKVPPALESWRATVFRPNVRKV